MSYVDKLWLTLKIAVQNLAVELREDEAGDTNFISILIVLGIVIMLVVVFRGYITQILQGVRDQVSKFDSSGF